MKNKCNCSNCILGARTRRVLRHGDKKEMRALIREMHDMLGFFDEELEGAQRIIHHLTHQPDETPETKTYVN